MGSLNRTQRAALRKQLRKYGITTRRKRGLRGEGLFSALAKIVPFILKGAPSAARSVAPRLTKASLKASAKAATQAAEKSSPQTGQKMDVGAATCAASGVGGLVIKKPWNHPLPKRNGDDDDDDGKHETNSTSFFFLPFHFERRKTLSTTRDVAACQQRSNQRCQ